MAMKHLCLAMILLVSGCVSNQPTATIGPGQSVEQQLLNQFRVSNGAVPVQEDAQLTAAARAHANDMAERGYFAHVSPTGGTLSARLKQQNYDFCFAAENIAQGQITVEQVMQAWKTSRGHRENMLAREAVQFGLARAPGNTWVMVLGAKC